MKEDTKEIKLLSPQRETLRINGKLSYKEGTQAWSLLQLKKEILLEFPQLKEKRGKFCYMMTFHRNFKEIKKELAELEEKNEVMPILLLFGKEKEN